MGRTKDWAEFQMSMRDLVGYFHFCALCFIYCTHFYLHFIMINSPMCAFFQQTLITCYAPDTVLNLEYFSEQIKDPCPHGPSMSLNPCPYN